MAKVTNYQFKGREYTITVDERGWFSVKIDENVTLDSDKYHDLVEKIEKQVKVAAKKVNVRACRYSRDHQKVVCGSFTGVHAGTGNYLFKTDGVPGSEQIYRSYSNDSFLPEECADEYQALCAARDKAIKAVNVFVSKNRANFSEKIDNALKSEQ